MPTTAPLPDLVYSELRDRYDRLRRRSGAIDDIGPPNPELARALAEVAETRRGPDSVGERVHYAGETYEYLLQRWRDPQWRALVAASRAMERLTSPPRQRPNRYARFFSQVLLAPSDA